jgi:hypothetical protein
MAVASFSVSSWCDVMYMYVCMCVCVCKSSLWLLLDFLCRPGVMCMYVCMYVCVYVCVRPVYGCC